ncbi:MAG: chromate transporter [Victivallales bacterium]|nr:chromate transporter [Victivallales bacterium]
MMMTEKDDYWFRVRTLFWTFFRISALTVGGGFAMIPIIEEEFVRRKKWISEEDIADVLAVGQSVPGVIAANTAVFIGYRMAGFGGALAGVFGVVVPPYVVIVLVAAFMTRLSGYPVLEHAFIGVRAGVCALIVLTVAGMGKKILKGRCEWVIATVAFIALVFFRLNPIWVIVGSAVFGLVWYYLGLRGSLAQAAGDEAGEQ